MVQKIPVSGLENAGGAFKNLIINGDMRIAQRATGTTTISNNSIDYATVDRWFVYEYSDAVLTSEQHDMSAADQATTGQTKAMELNVTTADSSIASGQWCFFAQAVEAQFCQSALYGTSAAKDLTLSFWVKSNKTGTYAVMLDKNDSTRYRLPITYTIDSADTWEKKVINISPTVGSTTLITDANGAIANDNGIGFHIWWTLAAGTDFQGTNNSWTSSEKYTTSDQVNWLDSTSNNFHITGVQLEIGSGASDFEHLPHDVQLRRCKRYYQQITGSYAQYGQIMNGHYNGTSQFQGAYTYPVEMRSSPTLSHTTTSSNNTSSAYAIATVGSVDYIDALLLYNSNDQSTLIYTAGNASNDTGMGGNMYVQSTITELALVSEL